MDAVAATPSEHASFQSAGETRGATYLDVAFTVLNAERRVLSANEIVDIACRCGLLTASGKTPVKTMNARLSVDILRRKARSRFMRTDSGRFALRDWAKQMQEYIAPRRTIALFDEDIAVFDRDLLRRFIPNDGLTGPNIDYMALLSSCRPMRRRNAEQDFSVIQLVSGYVVRFEDKVLTYRRSKRLPEARLHHTYSLLFGGHLNPDDLLPLFSFSDPETLLYMLDRELNEELIIASPKPRIDFLGLLYDPRSEISTQHVAIVFDVLLGGPDYKIGERGFLIDPKFETKRQINARINDFENWSQYLLNTVVC